MASSSLISRIVLSAAFVAAAGTGVVNHLNKGKIEQVRQEATASKEKAIAAEENAKKAAGEAKAAKDEAKVASDAKAAAEAKAGTVAAEAEKSKKDAETAQAQIQEKETQIADLTKKLADAAGNTNAAPVAPAQDPEMAKKLADAIAVAAEKETLLKSFQAKAEEAEKEATALKADNARRVAGLNKPGLEGKVLAVNPNWNFVVLSIGDRQGVVSGSSLIVKRGGNLVAKLRVTSVEPSTSIADVQVGTVAKGSVIQPGDVVIFPGS